MRTHGPAGNAGGAFFYSTTATRQAYHRYDRMRRKTTQRAPLAYTANNGIKFFISKSRGRALWRFQCVACGASQTIEHVSNAMHSVQDAEQLAEEHSFVCRGRMPE
jgi:hypothetical protein